MDFLPTKIQGDIAAIEAALDVARVAGRDIGGFPLDSDSCDKAMEIALRHLNEVSTYITNQENK